MSGHPVVALCGIVQGFRCLSFHTGGEDGLVNICLYSLQNPVTRNMGWGGGETHVGGGGGNVSWFPRILTADNVDGKKSYG